MTDKEKIKAALRFCSDKPDNCIGCPVFSPDDVSECTSNVMNVAANIIDRLEADNAALREKLAAAKKRADAAIEDIRRIAPCSLCKHNGKQSCKNEDAGHEKCFEWRGEKEKGPLENGGIVGILDKKNGDTGDLGTSGEQEGEKG